MNSNYIEHNRREDERLRLYPVESVIVALPGASVYTPAGSKMCQRVAADGMEGTYCIRCSFRVRCAWSGTA